MPYPHSRNPQSPEPSLDQTAEAGGNPVVTRIRIFPIKSLPGIDVAAARFTAGGGLVRDREFALCDATGYVNAKREPKVHALRVRYDAALSQAHLRSLLTGDEHAFGFGAPADALEAWLGRHFGRAITVRRATDGGFPDDPAAPGPTLVTTATLAAVASWFADLETADVRDRLRTNIEIGGVPAFWEDRLYAGAGTSVPFAIGAALLAGTNPCQRCVVPTRDPDTGAPRAGFAKRVGAMRAATLPRWADRSRFDHYYRLTVNTRLQPAAAGTTIRVGDAVVLATARDFVAPR